MAAIHFSKAVAEIKRAAQKETLLFCLDFDGTLTPIRRNPDTVKPSAALLKFLKKAASLSSCRVAVISGRALNDLRRRIPVAGVILVGSHGLEWDTQKMLRPSSKLLRLRQRWSDALQGIQGVFFEEKPFSFVLHYRRCSKKQQKKVVDFFLAEQSKLFVNGFELTVAHKAFEVFAGYRGKKEEGVHNLLKRFQNARLIVAGDDVTDYEMLGLGAARGWAVSVGFSRAGVKYFCKGPGEFVALLTKIISA